MALGAVNAGCAYNRPIPESPLAGIDGTKAPLTERWLLRTNRGMSLPVAVAGDRLYGVGIDRRVVAVDLDRGRERWAYRMDGPAMGGLLLRNDTIIATSERPGGEVVALAAATGRRVWKRRVGWVGAPIALPHDLVVVQTRTRGTWALSPVDGEVRWRLPLGGGRVSAIAGPDSTILIATIDSTYIVAAGDGEVLQRRGAPGAMMIEWVPARLGLLAATGGGEVVLFDPGTMNIIWRRPLDGPVAVMPTVRGDSAWIPTTVGTVWRIDLATGEPTRLLTHPTPISAPLATWDGALLVGDAKGILSAYDTDGTLRWQLAVGKPVDTPPFEFDGDLIVIGGRGDVHRFAK